MGTIVENSKAYHPLVLPTEKRFGQVFAALLALAALYFGLTKCAFYLFLLVPTAGLLATGYLRPAWLRLPNHLWFQFGQLLHRLMSPLFLALLYLLAILPTALALRLFRKDILRLTLDPTVSSYWIVRAKADSSMMNQF